MTLKAKVAMVELGTIQMQGILLPTEGYAVAIPQIAEIFGTHKNYASQELKRLLGEGFRPHKIRTELGNQLINVISLADFKKVVFKLALKGNELAQALTESLLEEGIERRFAQAFNIKFDEEEANERLKLRMKRLLARHDWTDVLMERHLDYYGKKPESHHYRMWTVQVNKKLFGQPHFRCDRDNMTQEQQEIICDFERMAKRRANQYPDISPDELVSKALDTF